MEKKLLILGLLLSHDMHGYQLNEVLEKNPGTPISLKKSNAYKILSDMEKDGWINHSQEQEGNRPRRRVYSVTKKGEAEFYRLLRENLSSHSSPEFPSIVGLDFLHLLPTKEAIALLEIRLNLIKEKFQQFDNLSSEIKQNHLTTEYLHQFYEKQIEWLSVLIARLQSN